MTTFGRSDDLSGAEFVDTDLSGARFVGAFLNNAVMRGVDVQNVDIDSPWVVEDGNTFRINGVDVVPFVDAELNKAFPGREQRRAGDPEGLRAAWNALEQTWAATLQRVAAMPDGTVDLSVGGEWSFAQTLRHLVHATDMWLGKAILELEEPFHPIGQPNTDGGDDRVEEAVSPPAYANVLEVRAGRMAMVRDFIAAATADDLAAERRNPHSPERPETVRSCLHVILEEEWEHHRYAVRDLAVLDKS